MVYHSNKQMALEFKETFEKGQSVKFNDIPTIMQCKNIDFGHVDWAIGSMYSGVLVNNTNFMAHLVDNIVDITVHDNNNPACYSFMCNVVAHSNETVFKYVINNRCVNNELFACIDKECMPYLCYQYVNIIQNLSKWLTHLNNTSLYKFTGYYNLEKYHYMIPIMLLVTRVQTVLPKCIIKCLIIPFIYR